jgi:hypothetical protein
MDCDEGVMAIDETVMNTVAVAVFVTLSELAVSVTVPTATPVSTALPEPVTVAIESSLVDQETPLVKFMPCWLVLTPKACTVVESPNWTEGEVGLIVIEVSVGLWKNPWQLGPKASATKTVKASVNASLRPVNIDNRLR